MAIQKMANIRADKITIDLDKIDYSQPLFRLANFFVNTTGKSTGPRFNLEFYHEGHWIPTRRITFLAQNLHLRIKPNKGKFGKSYSAFFSENSDGVSGNYFKLMDALQKMIEDPDNDRLIRKKLGLTPKEALVSTPDYTPKDPLRGPIFLGESKNGGTTRLTSLSFRPASDGSPGTQFITTSKDVAESLGMRWVEGDRPHGISGPEIFDIYLDPARVDERPTLITATRFVINELARTTTGASFRIYTNSVVIRGIATKTETVAELLEFEADGVPTGPLQVKSTPAPTPLSEVSECLAHEECHTTADEPERARPETPEPAPYQPTHQEHGVKLPPQPVAATGSMRIPKVKSYGLAQ